MEHTKSCIVVEGGGFKTGFTSGILDAFMAASYDPFHQYLGVSGGSVALSYFLSQQYRCCLNSILTLAKDKNFLKFTRSLGTKGYMNIDFIAEVARSKVPFEIAKAMERLTESDVYFVATNRNAGIPEYITPGQDSWLDVVVASCTLPFVTKGKHLVNGVEYLDGGWSDPLPVKWAYDNGARDILVLRTRPTRDRTKQSWTDYFGSIYFNSNPNLSEVFDKAYQKYNEALEFIDNPPADLKIHQLAPKKPLKSTTYSYSKKSIMRDYRYGLDFGVNYLMKEKHLITT